MAQLMRFGRRLALPSTRQIRHELLVSICEDERLNTLKKEAAGPDIPAVTTRDPAVPDLV